jgi:hypothetical protein
MAAFQQNLILEAWPPPILIRQLSSNPQVTEIEF